MTSSHKLSSCTWSEQSRIRDQLFLRLPRDYEADTLLMLGTDFPYIQFYPEKATIIQVDCRGENLGCRTRLDLGLIGDVKATLSALVPLLDEKKDDTHLKRFIHHYQDTRKELDELAMGHPGRKPMHPQYVRENCRRDCGRRCDLLLRCRHADSLGGALSHHERQATPTGFV